MAILLLVQETLFSFSYLRILRAMFNIRRLRAAQAFLGTLLRCCGHKIMGNLSRKVLSARINVYKMYFLRSFDDTLAV